MECLPLHIAHIGIVEIIADQRMADVFHMYADLVCTTGFQLQGDQGVIVEFLLDPIMGDGTVTVRKIDLSCKDGSVYPGKWSINGTGGGIRDATANGKIFPSHLLFCHSIGQDTGCY